MARRRPPFVPPPAREGDRRSFDLRAPGRFVPSDRLRPILERWLSMDGEDVPPYYRHHTHETLCSRVPGLYKRKVWSILSGQDRSVSIAVADRLLIAMELSHLWHIEPEDGGFADIYFHEAIVGEAA